MTDNSMSPPPSPTTQVEGVLREGLFGKGNFLEAKVEGDLNRFDPRSSTMLSSPVY